MVAFGNLTAKFKTFRLHQGQSDVMRAQERFSMIVAGTGGGKTVTGPLWCAQEILKHKDRKEPISGMVLAPTYKILNRATVPALVEAFNGTDLQGRYLESKGTYDLPGGRGRLWLQSADRPDGLEGGQFDFVWADECGQMKFSAWVAIQARLGVREGRFLGTTTPYAQNWCFHKFYRFALKGDPDYYVRQFPSILNPAYPKREYERAGRAMSAQRFAMRYDGQFVKLAGLVYPDLSECFEHFDGPPAGMQHGGIDFGWSDPFAALAGSQDANDILHIWYERYKTRTNIREHARALPRGVQYWADPSSPDMIIELRNAGHSIRGNKLRSLMTGFDAVNARIYEGRLKIHPSCIALKAEAEEYAYPEKDDETHGELPVGGFDHALDTLRYLIGSMDYRSLTCMEAA